MKIGVQFPNESFITDPLAIRDFAQTAEGLGYSHLLIYEHVIGAVHAGRNPPLAVPYDEATLFHEPLVLLGYLSKLAFGWPPDDERRDEGARVPVRRVVTEEVDGRSRVVKDGPAPESSRWQDLWVSSPDDPTGFEPVEENAGLEPPAGGTRWRLFSVPPDAVIQKMIEDHLALMAAEDAANPTAAAPPQVTSRDLFHKTNTLDYVYVLEGDISLELEDGSVDLAPGGCVVQRGTNHAWHNRGDQPVKLLVVMTGLQWAALRAAEPGLAA